MFKKTIFLFLFIALAVGLPQINKSDLDAESSFINYVLPRNSREKVTVKLYYESFSPKCIELYPHFVTLVEKLGANINLETYPYGNTQMRTENGEKVFTCEHGEKECYGNKLHACAMDRLNHDMDVYVKFVACLIKKNSDDAAVEQCVREQNLHTAYTSLILDWAKGDRGQELLTYYGMISDRVSYPRVPYVLINGKPKPDDQDLIAAVCQAFKNPPNACNAITNS